MMNNRYLNYYLGRAAKGDGKAAYEAAKIMRDEKANEVIIQTQLRKSATLGYAPAQRTLGILGLCGLLVHPDSKTSHIMFYETIEPAISWLSKAADNNDTVAKYTLCKCMQLGIGIQKNEEKAERMMDGMINDLSMDTIVSLMYIFDSVKHSKQSIVSPEIRVLLLAS